MRVAARSVFYCDSGEFFFLLFGHAGSLDNLFLLSEGFFVSDGCFSDSGNG